MRVTTKGRYGLTLMMDLAVKHGEGPISLKSIAQRHNLSDHYLEQLITPLRTAGLVKSIRGAYGGYILTRTPDKISAGDVIRVLEGPIEVVDISEEDEPAKRQLWLKIRNSVKDVLDGTTLQDLVSFGEKKEQIENYMFYI